MSKIATLLLTGANNHDWRRTSPFFRELLNGSGLFEVTLAENASEELEDVEALKQYQLIFSDYNGPAWSEAARANFLAAVESGTGLVILHAADNAFGGWAEYERLCGLVFQAGSGHGEFHEFAVNWLRRDHPVAAGLQNFRTTDELYHRMVHLHDAPYEVIATAFSDEKRGGTGRDEPVIVVTRHGLGRVFHDLLGHVYPGDPDGEYRGASMVAVENPDFQRTLLRGAEWAATGQVAAD